MRDVKLFLCGLGLLCCSMSARPAVASQWPGLDGLVGAYGVQTSDQLAKMSSNGFKLALMNYNAANIDLAGAIGKNGIRTIDPYPWAQIRDLCKQQLKAEGYCDRTSQDQVLANVRSYLAEHANNKAVVGYWILDDYPGGDIRDLLIKVHNLIAQANAKSGIKRAAICGFGGRLDDRAERVRWATKPNGFARYLQNFEPKACDVVALYPYAVTRQNDPTTIDWSMNDLLPTMLGMLRDRGWDASREPFIGMPQAFGGPQRHGSPLFHPVPTGDNLARQVEAYCRAGAIAIMAYSWDDGKHDGTAQLYNAPELVSGLKSGANRCRAIWRK